MIPTGLAAGERKTVHLKLPHEHKLRGHPMDRGNTLLADCKLLLDLAHEQSCGAPYKRPAAIGHTWGMSKAERVRWYRVVAESIPLSDRYAGHILARLNRRAA